MRRIRNGEGGKIISIVIVMSSLIQIAVTRKIASRSFWWFSELTTRNLCGERGELEIFQSVFWVLGDVVRSPVSKLNQ
jgi:hypothetical protein